MPYRTTLYKHCKVVNGTGHPFIPAGSAPTYSSELSSSLVGSAWAPGVAGVLNTSSVSLGGSGVVMVGPSLALLWWSTVTISV